MAEMTGRLEVIVGPMFSGKSDELIRRLRRAKVGGKKVIAFKPTIDQRYEIKKIMTHDGAAFDCLPCSHPYELTMHSRGFDVIGIDEVQFFEGYRIQDVIPTLINNGKTIIVSGLDMTYRRQPWINVPWLMAVADRVDKLSAVCHKCGKDAVYTQRLVDGEPASFTGPTVQVGGLETYEARCRECFQEANES